MASLIACPHCGPRPREEFSVRGDAAPLRPAPDAAPEAWLAYLHARENPRGPHREHWRHEGGCGRWLVVARDTATHEVFSVTDVQAAARSAAREGRE
ncbi:N-methylglutamate dehydrogenase subunit B [Albimonas donghaensis]|uniref:N-methylglutamate dehydrogenase subunit B n=1 Tax=Albimonas donghaensis TaxID=356660 RepID=A0A1H2W4L6_9RHOB|nr:sarcosine oxidase subunit delta [Albimonas donghaensis]SDW75019.1 N-methylglutamate dehydrogenase subunit B [Albimonas donghaensis]